MTRLYTINSAWEPDKPIEGYSSLIWTERFSDMGDFEINAPYNETLLENLDLETNLQYVGSDKIMIVEQIEEYKYGRGAPTLKFMGRSKERILDDRIVPLLVDTNDIVVTYAGRPDVVVMTIVNNYCDRDILTPDSNNGDVAHSYPNFTSVNATGGVGSSKTWQIQPGSLYERVKEICAANNMGFKIQHLAGAAGLNFRLYVGEDRTINAVNPSDNTNAVKFGPKYDNFSEIRFVRTSKDRKSAVRVQTAVPSGDTIAEFPAPTYGGWVGTATGYSRREAYLAASDIKARAAESIWGPRGERYLGQHNKNIKLIDGKVKADDGKYVYGIDYNLGDKVLLMYDRGIQLSSRVTEFIWAEDANGSTRYPTLEEV